MIRAGNEIRAALIRADNRVMLHDMAGRTRTARQLLENVDRVAGALIARGAYGGKIGLWYRNSLRAVEAFLAVEWIGGTRVPVDPHAPPAEAKEVFAAAGVDLVVADRAHAMVLETPSLIHDDDTPLSGSPTWPAAKVSPDKTLLLYPRAVNLGQLYAIPVSYANWRATMRTNIDLYESGHFGRWLGGDECFLAAQQIMHGTGFVGTFPFLEMGLPQVLAETFDAAAILEAIDRHRVTTTVLVPPMMSRLVDAAIQRPGAGASLGHLIYGGAPVPPDEIRRTMRCFGWPRSWQGTSIHAAFVSSINCLTRPLQPSFRNHSPGFNLAPGAPKVLAFIAEKGLDAEHRPVASLRCFACEPLEPLGCRSLAPPQCLRERNSGPGQHDAN